MNNDAIDKLAQVEAEMRRIGYWLDDPPPVASFASASFLAAGGPTFETWLQIVFLPNARHAARTGTMPAKSDVGVMALRQYDYHSLVPEAHGLMRLLFEFDEIVSRA